MATKIQKKQVKPVKERSKLRKFLTRPIPMYFFVLLFLPMFAIAFHHYKPLLVKKTRTHISEKSNANPEPCASIYRKKKDGLIAPLLFVEINDDGILSPLQAKVINFIEQKKQEGKITSASVYL